MKIKRKFWAVATTNIVLALILTLVIVGQGVFNRAISTKPTDDNVPGENYEICNEASQYLTSPWTYDAVGSGDTGTYTVAEYEALSGYGTTLPSLPSYISSESSSTEAAVIFGPGATVDDPAYVYPDTPIVYYFEGGSYGQIGLESMGGDEFIGGSATGYPEPVFDDGGEAGGISSANDSYGFDGGGTTLASTATTGATSITTTSAPPSYVYSLTFADGTTYSISSVSGDTINLSSELTTTEDAGTNVYTNREAPIAHVSTSASQGATTVELSSSSMPIVPWDDIAIGGDIYQPTSISGSESGYTLTLSGGLDFATPASTPVYYGNNGGDETVQYLTITHDLHLTTGTFSTGSGWTIENDEIADSYDSTPGYGVGIYGGDNSTIEYNCFSQIGDYAANIFGSNTNFNYNEVYETNYEPDPGCGCSGGGKWWGTFNTNIEDDAFIGTSVQASSGGNSPAIWFDNGNTGMLVEGNYFYDNSGTAVDNETGFNMDITDNLFENNGWGDGQGDDTGEAIELNSSGGLNITGSRYNDEILIQNNYLINNWQGIEMWESGARSCENSGESYIPVDAAYCSGGFPTTGSTSDASQYDFSHVDYSEAGTPPTLATSCSGSCSTIEVTGPEAIDDQIGFGDPALTYTTSSGTNVSSFTGSGTIDVGSTTGFPPSGELRIGTSAAWSEGGGSYTGAVVSYTGTSSTSFTGVTLVSGSGTLETVDPSDIGTSEADNVIEVEPYKVTSETCYTNDCTLHISPSVTTSEAAGTEVSNSGTCQLYATSTATPTSPVAPDGTSYWDGCQWEVRNVSVSGNTFTFEPSVIADSTPPQGDYTSTVCSTSYTDSCGTNFMATQVAGENPFDDQTIANMMMSSSSFTTCPSWDSGCSTDPLNNLNALSDPPGATANNDDTAGNNVWSDNTYNGPWGWTAYLYGTCTPLPSGIPSDACGTLSFSQWQSDWQQDTDSTYNPSDSNPTVSISSPTTNQEFYGPSATIDSSATANDGGSISSCQLVINSSYVGSPVNSSPYDFTLDTVDYSDGTYNVGVQCTDNESNTGSYSNSVYISNGDLNSDGTVGLSDLAILAAHYGTTSGATYQEGSILENGAVNLSDLSILAANWGWSE